MSIFEIKHINQFIYDSDKAIGTVRGGIYVLKSEQQHNIHTKYQIKTSLRKTGVANEFAASYILRQIIGDRAPENYIIQLDHKGSLGIASKFISGYITSERYNDTQYYGIQYKESLKKATEFDIRIFSDIFRHPNNPALYKPYAAYSESSVGVEADILADFIGHRDFHVKNKGFVINNEKTPQAALIDFDNSLGKDSIALQHNYPRVQYYTGAEEALGFFKLIKQNFALISLDKLDDLFNSIDLIRALERIKLFMKNKLVEVDHQIFICELALRLKNNAISEEEYNNLISSNIDIERFALKDIKDNPLADGICKMQDKLGDIAPIVDMINKDNFPISSFVKYCFFSKNSNLLFNIIPLLKVEYFDDKKKKLITEVINQSHNLEELNIAIELIKTNNIKVEAIDELLSCLRTDCKNLEKLFNQPCYPHTIETALTLKILIIGLKEHKIQKLDFESNNGWYHFWYAFETLYLANDIDTLTKLIKTKNIEYFFDKMKGAIHSENLPFAQFILSQLTDIDKIKEYALLTGVNTYLMELKYHQVFRENLCNLFKGRIEELGYSFLEQDLVVGSSAQTYHCNDILVSSITHDEL